MGERNEVSVQEVRVYEFLCTHPGWHSSQQIAAEAQVQPRTARAHAAKFVELGLVDLAEVFPGHRYRWAALAENRNRSYVLRLKRAAEVFTNHP